MTHSWIRIVFFVSGLYDAILGFIFLLFARNIFEEFGVTPPNHPGYIQFPAILLVLFGVMFLQVASNPPANRDLMLYGAGLKAAYCAVVFWHDWHGGVPALWMPWAWADLAFLIAFLAAWRKTRVSAGQ